MTAPRLRLAHAARALLAAAALVFGTTAHAIVASDDFTSGGYAGGTGWATSWTEIGETDGATAGDLAVVADSGSNRLRVKNASHGAWRAINLAGAITATLSFGYRRVALDNASDYVAIEISYNGGTNWYELGRLQGAANDTGYTTASYDISAYATANTRIRFIASSSLGGSDIVYFDNVTIDYTVLPPPGPAQSNLSRCTPLTGGGIVNTYYPGTASITAGSTSIPVGTPTGSSQPIAAGDTLLVMQMQDAAINATNTGAYGDGVAADPARGATNPNNAGRFEYVTATSAVVAGTVNVTPATTYAYTHANAGTQGQRRYQVIRVMTTSSGTLVNGLTAPAWNGSTGGILTVDVIGALALNNAVVDVSGLGFRGGGARQLAGGAGGANTDYRNLSASNFHAQKGEGVAGTPRYVYTPAAGLIDTSVEGYPNGSTGRGAPGNAGGGGSDGNPAANDQNTGGGGGGNGGGGGQGGWAWVPTAPPPQTGGFGGASALPTGNRLPMGGGGGAGTVNNNTGTPPVLSSSGAAGGGVILVRAGTVSGSGFLFARGAPANVSVGNDAGGGGGAGGSVVLFAASGGIGAPVIDVSGGSGGSNNGSGVAHGPGGGGGGGFIGLSAAGATPNVSGGPNGLTTIVGSDGAAYQSSYGATAGSPGIVTTAIAAGTLPGTPLPASCATIASFLIDIGGATGSTCAPKNITITARDASNNVIPGYTGTIALATSTGRGDWALVTGGGTLANGAANDGTASYTFVAGDNGVVTLSLANASADDLTVNVSDASVPSTATTSSAIAFRDNAFVITNDAIQVAGRNQAMSVALWRRDPSTGNNCAIASGYNGARALDAWITRDALDPGGAAPTIGALALPSSAPAANPASNNLSLAFLNGVATFNLSTTDVGKYVLNLRDDSRSSASGMDIIGATNSITTRPFALHVDVPGNPGANASTGTFFRAAGADFASTVRAVLWQAADDANNDGIPDAGASATDNGTAPSYAWPTTLEPTMPYTPATPADAPAGTGVAGALNNGTIAQTSFSGGAATVANLQYTEIGSFTLRATATNYLATAGANLASVVGVVGRFRPFDFGVSYNTPRFTTFCGTGAASFTYVGQSFPYAVAPVLTVTARNAQGGTTRNYTEAGGWFKLTNASLTGKTYSALTGTLDTSLVPGTDPVIGNTGAGTATLTFADGGGLAFLRTNPVAPFDAEISLAIDVRDTEGVAFAANPARFGAPTAGNGIGFTQGKQMRFGRLRVLNAVGSERIALPVPLRLEYWTGSAFAVNTLDNCTTLASSSITLGNYQLNLGACETALGSGAIAFSGGAVTVTLAAPGAGNNGSLDLRVNLGTPAGQYCTSPGGAGNQIAATSAARSYLRGQWNASDDDGIAATTHDDDPVGRAAFGLYGADKTPNSFIYLRENY